MENELNNEVLVTNNNDTSTSITSKALVLVMIEDLTITKASNKEVWVDGYLTYTITINNQTDENYTSPVVKDIIDTELVKLVPNSIYVNNALLDNNKYNYNEITGELTINLDDINALNKTIITFQIEKI